MKEKTFQEKLDDLVATLEAANKPTPTNPGVVVTDLSKEFDRFIGSRLKFVLSSKVKFLDGVLCVTVKYLEGDVERAMEHLANDLYHLDKKFPIKNCLQAIGTLELAKEFTYPDGSVQYFDFIVAKSGRKPFILFSLVNVGKENVLAAAEYFHYGENEIAPDCMLYYPEYN